MAAKVPAYKREKNNTASYILILLVVCLLIVVIKINETSLLQKKDVYASREAELTASIENEKKRTKDLEEFARYVKTKKYVEEVAEEKLGLVHDGEIVFKPEDKK